MKKSNLIKGILLILLSIVLVGSTFVFAADSDDDVEGLLNLTGSGSSSTRTNNVVNNTTTNTNVNNTVNNTNVTNTNTNRVNNTSVYNTANKNALSDAGLADSMPVMVLVVVFGISAVYAYKKINDYKKF